MLLFFGKLQRAEVSALMSEAVMMLSQAATSLEKGATKHRTLMQRAIALPLPRGR